MTDLVTAFVQPPISKGGRDGMEAIPEVIQARFWAKVKKGEGCWLWTASLRNKGYGAFAYRLNRRVIQDRAHRFSWLLAFGPVPDGLFVLHRCDTPACVRPDHLFLGTNADNVRDMMAKGRHVVGGTHSGLKSKYRSGKNHWNYHTPDDVILAIRARRAAGTPYQRIADEFGLALGYVWRVATRRARRDVD